MPKYYEDKPETKASCSGLREDLKSCLLRSDCVKLDKMIPRECLKQGTRVDEECRSLQYHFFECKRSLLDMRQRFRGRKGY